MNLYYLITRLALWSEPLSSRNTRTRLLSWLGSKAIVLSSYSDKAKEIKCHDEHLISKEFMWTQNGCNSNTGILRKKLFCFTDYSQVGDWIKQECPESFNVISRVQSSRFGNRCTEHSFSFRISLLNEIFISLFCASWDTISTLFLSFYSISQFSLCFT